MALGFASGFDKKMSEPWVINNRDRDKLIFCIRDNKSLFARQEMFLFGAPHDRNMSFPDILPPSHKSNSLPER